LRFACLPNALEYLKQAEFYNAWEHLGDALADEIALGYILNPFRRLVEILEDASRSCNPVWIGYRSGC
jgi:hypothetical protein